MSIWFSHQYFLKLLNVAAIGDEAVDLAQGIIRAIRQRQFWPPGDPSQYGDEFVRLCADDALNRAELFELASRDRG